MTERQMKIFFKRLSKEDFFYEDDEVAINDFESWCAKEGLKPTVGENLELFIRHVNNELYEKMLDD